MTSGVDARIEVPLIDLASMNGEYEDQFVEALRSALRTGDYGVGAAVTAFEEQLADLVGTRFAIGVNSGTAALHLMLAAAGIGPGDEVVLPANTFFATAEAVVATGADVVLVDPDLDTALASPEAVDAAVGPRTAAIIGVHLYGQPIDPDGYRRVADRCGVLFFEDAAQAIGATAGRERVGSFGAAAGFSFYPTKNLGSLGQAGAITTDDESVCRVARQLRSHGEERRYEHMLMGFNERLHGLQAAFLSIKLPHVARDQRRRDAIVDRYDELLSESGCERVRVRPGVRSAHHLYVVRVPDRDAVLDELRADGVMAAVHYPVPIHFQPAWQGAARPGSLPVAERLAREIISLPIYPGMTDAQVERCAEALGGALERREPMNEGVAAG